jgi:phytoene dehydrogenase-like protein
MPALPQTSVPLAPPVARPGLLGRIRRTLMTMVGSVVARLVARRERYRWTAPDFSGPATTDCDVVVVGAGIGGLTAAALLAEAGLKVVVCEQHVVAGGFCHSYPRKARGRDGAALLFRFDAGPHDFSGVWDGGPVTALLRRLGVDDQVEWRRVDHAYHMATGVVAPPRDWRAYVRALQARFPASADGVAALFADIHAIFEGMYATGASRGGFPGMPSDPAELLAFPRRHPLAMKWMNRPFDELVARHVSDPDLVAVLKALTGYLGDDGTQLRCGDMVPIFGYYFKGGYYPVGGSSRFTDALVSALEARGGQLLLKTGVARILVEDGAARGVELADGRRITARAVVTNADLRRSFLDLVPAAALPEDFRAAIAAAAPATSAFTVQLGLDFVPDLAPSTHLAGQRLGLSCLSLVDASAAPAGHAILNLIRLVPQAEAASWFSLDLVEEPGRGHDQYRDWRRSDAYRARKEAIAEEMIAAAETVLPGLRSHIVHRNEASPLTYARYDWASGGSIYGVAGAGQLAGSKSPVRGLVVAGGGNAGAGVEAVVISGANAAEALVPGLLARVSAAAPAAALRQVA